MSKKKESSEKEMNGAKILFLDIETAPCKWYVWGMYQDVTNTNMQIGDWYILSWAAKWIGNKKTVSDALINYDSYKQRKEDDSKILATVWKLLDEADIVVAHNGIRFDFKKLNARFLINNMTPPSPYRVIDTLKVAKTHFAFTSNKLDSLGKFLGIGRKLKHSGFELWEKCMQGDLKSWKTMIKYNVNDVVLLEKIYNKLRPFIATHPNLGVYFDMPRSVCSKCGSRKIQYRGYSSTNVSRFRKIYCNVCGGWSRERLNLLSSKKRRANTTSL